MGRLCLTLLLAGGCTVITSPGDYEGGNADGGASCMDDDDCPSGVCDMLRGQCVQCRVATDCSPGEECGGGVCVPADCGGMVCPEETPVCLETETEETCVECVLPSDCPPGETCTAELTCQACMPAEACAADEVCIVDGTDDFCLDCDLDGDGLIRRDPRCVGVIGDLDCDDDDDGFCAAGGACLGECTELAGDCDDADAEVSPALVACGDSATGCGDPGAAIPGTGVGSVSAMELSGLEAPLFPGIRPPSSVVVADPLATGTFDVAFLSEPGASSYAARNRLAVDVDGRRGVPADLPATDLSDFVDLRVKVDPAGVLVAALGTATGSGIRSAEVVLTDGVDGEVVTPPLLFQDRSAVPPVDASYELDFASPYVVWCSGAGAECELTFGFRSMPFTPLGGFRLGDSLVVQTARGLVLAGPSDTNELRLWDPRLGIGESSPGAESGPAALANGESTLGFDARFADTALLVRSLMFTSDTGFIASRTAPVASADAVSRAALTVVNDFAYLALDVPVGAGRRVSLVRVREGGDGGVEVSEPLALTGTLTPDFVTVYGVEVSGRRNGDVDEVAVLVHGQLEGTDAPALYLFVARRCAP